MLKRGTKVSWTGGSNKDVSGSALPQIGSGTTSDDEKDGKVHVSVDSVAGAPGANIYCNSSSLTAKP